MHQRLTSYADEPVHGEVLASRTSLIVALTGTFSLAYLPSQINMQGDASTTMTNLVAFESLLRVGIVAGLVCYTVFLLLPLALYRLLSPVSRNAAVLMMAFAVAGRYPRVRGLREGGPHVWRDSLQLRRRNPPDRALADHLPPHCPPATAAERGLTISGGTGGLRTAAISEADWCASAIQPPVIIMTARSAPGGPSDRP